MPTAMQARGEGADLVGVLVLYDKSPYTIYWKKSRGIKSIKDFPRAQDRDASGGCGAADVARESPRRGISMPIP